MFNVMDVQNTPPVFKTGSLTGIVNEDDAVGTVIMKIRAKDGDTGNPRRIIYELIENPFNYFDIDTNSGELRIAKQLDRESLGASSGVLGLRVRASELVNGQPGNHHPINHSMHFKTSPDTQVLRRASITIRIRLDSLIGWAHWTITRKRDVN